MNRFSVSLVAAAAALSLTMLSARAQSPTATVVATKKTITREGARQVITAAVTEAQRTGSGAVIAVVDDGGNLIALERIDGTFPAGASISIGKARTAALFLRPTQFFEDVIKNGRTAMVALNDFTPLQGGVPLVVDGQIVGAVGVSGATNADRDREIATAAAGALTPTSASIVSPLPPPVLYYGHEQVAASFAAGAVLFDGLNGARNYMIHTSHREKPGMAEVHTRDTDLIYVIDGSFTFVTGGTVVGGKTIAPDEIRGASIDGGESRRLTKGDVIIVPAGTPHWFHQVDGPVSYYTIKVR